MHDPVTTRVMLILNLYRLQNFVFVVGYIEHYLYFNYVNYKFSLKFSLFYWENQLIRATRLDNPVEPADKYSRRTSPESGDMISLAAHYVA